MKIFSIAALIASSYALKLTTDAPSKCADSRPKEGTPGTVTISYYTNLTGGKTGDPCDCKGSFMDSNTFWAFTTPA